MFGLKKPTIQTIGLGLKSASSQPNLRRPLPSAPIKISSVTPLLLKTKTYRTWLIRWYKQTYIFSLLYLCMYVRQMIQLQSEYLVWVMVWKLASGVQIYRKFYSEEKELSNGVLGIHVKKSVAQPYIILSRTISVSFLASLTFPYLHLCLANVTAQKTGTV